MGALIWNHRASGRLGAETICWPLPDTAQYAAAAAYFLANLSTEAPQGWVGQAFLWSGTEWSVVDTRVGQTDQESQGFQGKHCKDNGTVYIWNRASVMEFPDKPPSPAVRCIPPNLTMRECAPESDDFAGEGEIPQDGQDCESGLVLKDGKCAAPATEAAAAPTATAKYGGTVKVVLVVAAAVALTYVLVK